MAGVRWIRQQRSVAAWPSGGGSVAGARGYSGAEDGEFELAVSKAGSAGLLLVTVLCHSCRHVFCSVSV